MRGGTEANPIEPRWVRARAAVLEALESARQRQALRRQERLLRQIIDANPSLIFVKDWDRRFVLVNEATAAVYGTTVDALVGKTDAGLNPNRGEVAHFLRDDREVMSAGRPKLIPEGPVTHPAPKETRWFPT